MANTLRRIFLFAFLIGLGNLRPAAADNYPVPDEIKSGAATHVDHSFRPTPPGDIHESAYKQPEDVPTDPFVDDPAAPAAPAVPPASGNESAAPAASQPAVPPAPGAVYCPECETLGNSCADCEKRHHSSRRRREKMPCDDCQTVAGCDCAETGCSTRPKQDCGCVRCRFGDLGCCEAETWRLFQHINRCDYEVHGWVSQGITTSDEGPASNFNGTLSFNDREEEYQLNQAYVTMAKNAVTDGCGWAFGGRVDFLYGTDSRFVEARGLEKRRDGSPHWNGERFYGIAVPQAYAEIAYNNLAVKFGHFYTITGYEVVTAPDNFFYSHSYTMQYGEPFTHTGMLATYELNENISLMGGIDRGWDNWEDDDYDRISTLAGVSWQNDNGWAIGFSGTSGQEPSSDGLRNDNRDFYSAVISKEFGDRLTIVTQHDRGFQDRGVSNTQDAEWYGIAQYIYYKVNCCTTAGVRMEWFRDDDGTRVASVGDRVTPNSNPTSGGGFIGDFFGLTAGVNWSPNGNLIVRPELRFDWFEADGNSNLPFDDGNSDDMVTGAVDVILLF